MYAVLLLVILCFASGILLFNYAMSKVDFAKNMFSSQMSALLVQSFAINATHITAWLQNAGTALVEITGAYVNGLIAALADVVLIEPGSVGAAAMQGVYSKGYTYSVKLLSVFNTVIVFDVAY